MVTGTITALPGTRSILQRLLSTDTSDSLAEGGTALLRIATGVIVATLHGWHKIAEGWQYAQTGTHWPLLDDTITLGFPLPVLFTAFAAASQFVGGWMLTIGAFTRIAALLVASTLLTAFVHNLQTAGHDAELAGLYALVTGAFVLIGGSRWSVDRRLERGSAGARGH